MEIKIKRIYEEATAEDGYRVLVDRIWPRGIKKEDAKIDWWNKNISPTTKLRQWFGHSPERWKAFEEDYIHELDANEYRVKEIWNIMQLHPTITLLYAAKDSEHNHALVLKEYLEKEFKI